MTAPWNISLPDTLTVGGEEQPIRTDYRVALDCFLALNDAELDGYNKVLEVIDCLYINEIPTEHLEEALTQAFWYLRGGEDEPKRKSPQLVSWAQDFNYIASPISKIIGTDIRGLDNLHWWSFLSAYMSIGDCMFAQIVRIRDMKLRGKKLDKADIEFYRRNRDAIDIHKEITEAEKEILDKWI